MIQTKKQDITDSTEKAIFLKLLTKNYNEARKLNFTSY